MSASKKTLRRPALWTALGFGIGIFLGRTVEMGLVAAAVLSGLALVGATTGFYRKARWTGWMVWVVVVLLGALRYHIDTALSPLPHLVALEVFGQRGVVTGRIVQEPERSDERVHFAIELEQVVADSAIYHLSGQVLVTVKDVYLPADYGDRVSLRGRLQRPRAVRNPGAFDYRAFLAQQDIYGTLFVGKPEQIVSVEHLPGHWLYERVVLPLRRAVRQSIERNLSGAPAGLLLGVLLGEKRRIPEEVRAAFRSTGLAHALVVSGLHVGMVGGFFFFGFRLLRLADRPSSAATIVALALYALATGSAGASGAGGADGSGGAVGTGAPAAGRHLQHPWAGGASNLSDMAGESVEPELPALLWRDVGYCRLARTARLAFPRSLSTRR